MNRTEKSRSIKHGNYLTKGASPVALRHPEGGGGRTRFRDVSNIEPRGTRETERGENWGVAVLEENKKKNLTREEEGSKKKGKTQAHSPSSSWGRGYPAEISLPEGGGFRGEKNGAITSKSNGARKSKRKNGHVDSRECSLSSIFRKCGEGASRKKKGKGLMSLDEWGGHY